MRTTKSLHRLFVIPVVVLVGMFGLQVPAHAATIYYFGGLQDGSIGTAPPEMVAAMANTIDPDQTPEQIPPGGVSPRGRYSQPFTLNGKLIDDRGNILVGARLQISVEPGPALTTDNNDDAEALPLAVVTTDAHGQWEANLPGLIERYIETTRSHSATLCGDNNYYPYVDGSSEITP